MNPIPQPAHDRRASWTGERGSLHGAFTRMLERILGPQPTTPAPKQAEAKNKGLDPEFITIGVELTALYVEGGIKTFKQYAASMKQDLGEIWENLKNDLRTLWEGASVENPDLEEVSRKDAAAIIAELDNQDQEAKMTMDAKMNHNPKNDPWLQMNLEWMRENQPDYLRSLTETPDELVSVLHERVQSARRTHYQAAQRGISRGDAEELAMAVLCPPPETEPEGMPITEAEWTAALNAVEAGADPT